MGFERPFSKNNSIQFVMLKVLSQQKGTKIVFVYLFWLMNGLDVPSNIYDSIRAIKRVSGVFWVKHYLPEYQRA